jgi:large subunit ribosomal protein L30
MAKKETKPQVKMLRITQVKSAIGYSVKHKATIRALGFHRLHETVIHPDTPTLRGMLSKVNHLVVIEEQDPS